jgi:hypothetical protein
MTLKVPEKTQTQDLNETDAPLIGQNCSVWQLEVAETTFHTSKVPFLDTGCKAYATTYYPSAPCTMIYQIFCPKKQEATTYHRYLARAALISAASPSDSYLVTQLINIPSMCTITTSCSLCQLRIDHGAILSRTENTLLPLAKSTCHPPAAPGPCRSMSLPTSPPLKSCPVSQGAAALVLQS